ncbi:MAG TPA: TonB-dependent receptor, partial [Pasteurellaceae bacterium]|nr:TonB-dependent receptor [Pasteurellaceae bacterium]
MKKHLLAILISNVFAASVYADTEDEADPDNVLPTIIVSATPFSQQVGTQKITQEQIVRRPTKDGNITELLRTNPNVQFSNTSDTSTAGGEIAPNEVSIHGEVFYNNNYTIDGLSNNDNLNPATSNAFKENKDPDGYSPMDLPGGGTQSFWIDSHLLKNVEAFDSNISAKYGHFTGGVINAELKDPDLSRTSGKVFYRITRDDWASFKVQNEEKFQRAESLGDQPQFTKQQYGIVLNQPINDKAGLLFQYSRTESKIPYHHSNLGLWNNQRRTSETLILRGVYLPDNGDLLKASIMYSPHQSRYYKSNIKDGKFTNTGGGFQANLQWDHNFSWGEVKSYLSYKKTGNKIKHTSNIYNYFIATDSIDWCSSYNSTTGACSNSLEGGYGTFKTEKETWTFKQDYSVTSFETGPLEHNVIFGWEIDLAKAKYEREQDAYANTYRATTATSCTQCIPGEQYLRTYTLYPARNVKATDNTYAAYLEDSITWKNVNATLGVRLDHDEYLGNTNIAPRISVAYDIFGDQSTRLFGGYNRYYAGTMITYKLRNSIGMNQLYTRTSATSTTWTLNNRNTNYDISDLNTPYSDEYALGITQKIYNTLWTLKWVNRHGKDQFTRTSERVNGVLNYYMTNQGRSKNDTFTLTIEPTGRYKFKYADVDFRFGAQISDTTKNYNTYDMQAEDDGYDAMVLNGQLKALTEGLPAKDYNSKWSTFLEWNTYFPGINLDWSQRFSYNAGYRYYETNSGSCPAISSACGNYTGRVKIYDEKKQGSYFNLDWRGAYKHQTFKDQYLELTLDVNNVLDRKILTQSASNTATYK